MVRLVVPAYLSAMACAWLNELNECMVIKCPYLTLYDFIACSSRRCPRTFAKLLWSNEGGIVESQLGFPLKFLAGLAYGLVDTFNGRAFRPPLLFLFIGIVVSALVQRRPQVKPFFHYRRVFGPSGAATKLGIEFGIGSVVPNANALGNCGRPGDPGAGCRNVRSFRCTTFTKTVPM
jgi:hypothetical protein